MDHRNKSLLEKLNDPQFIKKLQESSPPSKEWWDKHLVEVAKSTAELISDHKALKMSWEKFNRPFNC